MQRTTRPSAPAAAPIAEGETSAMSTSAGTGRRVGRSRKRRRIAAPGQDQESGWASLPGDMVRLVALRVLAGDVVDYMSLRAACSGWRACTPDPRDASLEKQQLRPRGWVALCDGDAARPDDAREVTFFHASRGRCLRVRLPRLRGHRIVGFSDGLLVLLHKRTTAVRVLHPFTRAVLDLPPIAPTFRVVVGKRESLLCMNAAVCTGSATPTSIDVVAWFPRTTAVFWAKHGAATWDAIYLDAELQSVLPFRGRLYATTRSSREILQVYPRNEQSPVDTPIPDEFGEPSRRHYFLVESDGRMLLAVKYHSNASASFAFKMFIVDLDRRQLTPVSSLGDRGLFLGKDRCLSVSARHLPSISSNSVYFSEFSPLLYSLSSGLTEWLSASCKIHNNTERIGASVRPFTIADHLITYCNHLEWARGLMFHEYHYIPESFKELHEKIKKQDSQLRIPSGRIMGKTSNPSAT